MKPAKRRKSQQPPVRQGTITHSRLHCIRNLSPYASKAGYKLNKLALILHISTRQLRRFIEATHHLRPHEWLNKLRLQRALRLRRQGKYLKEIAELLGFKSICHLSRLLSEGHK